MADDDRIPASVATSRMNAAKIAREGGTKGILNDLDITRRLRQELSDKGLRGFKKGGKVQKTGKAKVHKGEYVVKASAAKKAGPKKLAQLNRGTAKVSPARKSPRGSGR